MLRNQKGITLVALVITIVILIILATVAISFAFNGGLIPYAEKAKKVGEQDSENSAIMVNDAIKYMETLVANGTIPSVTE